jgi:hypothetical protein
LLRSFLIALIYLVLALLSAWAAAALYFDFPWNRLGPPAAVLYGLAVTVVLWRVEPRGRALGVCLAGFLVVLAWWLLLKPSNARLWQPDVSETPWAEIQGDRVTIHNVRNCDYRTETDYTPHWETRTYDLSAIRGIDIFITYWGSPWIAHPIVSFQFADGSHLAASIEARKEVGEGYSAVRGFFRQYELVYIFADERDVVRLRTNYRQGEEVYLFRTRTSPERARAIFLDYLKSANELHEKPEWYNAVTSNCTTNIRAHAVATSTGKPQPWDWRILLNGRSEEMMYERGALAGDLPLPELKQRAHINAAAKGASLPDYSRVVREGRPGF